MFNLTDKIVDEVVDIDAEHKVDIADSGWFAYVKEVRTQDTDNVL